jgi:hypothetical protein
MEGQLWGERHTMPSLELIRRRRRMAKRIRAAVTERRLAAAVTRGSGAAVADADQGIAPIKEFRAAG